jgi:hypothetical protein
MIRDAFHHQVPFVGSGGPYSPGPATSTPLLTMGKPLDADLSSPWVLRRSSPVFTGESDSRRTFRSTRLPTVSPADLRADLDPRSLDPGRSFWSAFAELIRGQTPPDDFCNCVYDVRATKPGLFRSSQGRRPRSPSFSSTHHALDLRREWCAASRAPSTRPDPSAGSSRLREFAQP